jgi:hypothetical protein
MVHGGNRRKAAAKPLRVIPDGNNERNEVLIVQNTLCKARLRPGGP